MWCDMVAFEIPLSHCILQIEQSSFKYFKVSTTYAKILDCYLRHSLLRLALTQLARESSLGETFVFYLAEYAMYKLHYVGTGQIRNLRIFSNLIISWYVVDIGEASYRLSILELPLYWSGIMPRPYSAVNFFDTSYKIVIGIHKQSKDQAVLRSTY